jgi:hypothetical protein
VIDLSTAPDSDSPHVQYSEQSEDENNEGLPHGKTLLHQIDKYRFVSFIHLTDDNCKFVILTNVFIILVKRFIILTNLDYM